MALVVEEVKKRKGNEGYNVISGEYADLVKAGIVDPTKVTRSALQNAASISGLLLTTEAIVTEMPEKEKTPPMPGGGMGGMGGMDTKPNKQMNSNSRVGNGRLFCFKRR